MKRFQKGSTPRLQRGRRTTVSDSVNMSLTAEMKRSMSLGISSCRQPSLVSNSKREIAAGEKTFGEAPKNRKAALYPPNPRLTRVPRTFKAELVELSSHICNGGLVLAATPEELDALQQISDHLVDDGGEGFDLLQLQHFGVEDAAESGPLWSCAGEQRSVSGPS